MLRCTPFNLGAAFFISNRLCCQATVAAPHHRFASVWTQHRAGALCFFLRGGAEPTAFPPSLSTGFVDPFLSARPASSPSRLLRFGGGGFYHHRVGCQLRSLTSYFVFHFFSSGASVASATSPFRPRGRGFYRFAPGGVNRLRRLSSSHPPDFVACATSVFRREAASTTAALRVNSVLPTPYSDFQFGQEHSPPLRFGFPVRGGAASTTTAWRVNPLLRPSSSHWSGASLHPATRGGEGYLIQPPGAHASFRAGPRTPHRGSTCPPPLHHEQPTKRLSRHKTIGRPTSP